MSRSPFPLGAAGVELGAYITRYNQADPIQSCEVSWDGMSGQASTAEGAQWSVQVTKSGEIDAKEGQLLAAEFHSEGVSEQSTVNLSFQVSDWSVQHYVLVPGAVYAGNRFGVRELSYAPCWTRLSDHGADVPTLITDVPHLSIDEGAPSAFHLLTGDAATPAIGFVDEKNAIGWLFVTEQGTALGDTSMHLEENGDRSTARISFQAPGVRPALKYEMATTKVPSADKSYNFKPGDSVILTCRVYRFPCGSVPALFEKFAEVRRQGQEAISLARSLPFSAAWDIQEKKYNELNWNAPLGYYAVGTIDMKHQDWQVGWVGGGMSSLALLQEGTELSVSRSLDTLRFMFGSQTPSGFFHGVCYNGQWFGDEFNDAPNRPYPEQWHIVRKSADALYFILKHFIALEQGNPSFVIPEPWLEGTRKLADAFVRLWRKYGQFGQWVHNESGDILIGNSAGAAMAPAGLALCGQYFADPAYSEIAEASALYYYNHFTAIGVTTGGPGEILQCPDSESAFALLESYMVLYETSGNREWIKRAEEAALQAMSWCVSYDFRFPAGSTFERLGIRTSGSVIANVQNKHSAPGICTLSGDSLLKLHRATGKEIYLELLREIAGHLPQYLSREDRPVRGWDGQDMPPGYMSERVNMSDWEGKAYVGEVIPYSCWCEVSLMLTYAELPGIYVNKTSGRVTAIDQVECRVESAADGRRMLSISNPGVFPASVKLLMEDQGEAELPLGSCASSSWQRVAIAAGETVYVIL